MDEIDRIRNKIKHKKKLDLKKTNKFSSMFSRILIVIVLTLIALIFLKSNYSFKDKFYKYVFEDNLSFASINNLYQKYFGNPLPFSDVIKEKTTPTFDEKLTFSKSEKYKDGVKLSVDKNYLVPALESGMVIFVGEKEGYGHTIIIEQTNGVEVWYSNVNSSIKMYDYIEKGSLVGEASDVLYLVFKKDGNVLNYEEYI